MKKEKHHRKKDLDKAHDLTDPKVFKERMREEDAETKAPCGKCIERDNCVDPFMCIKYKSWRKKYLSKRYACGRSQ